MERRTKCVWSDYRRAKRSRKLFKGSVVTLCFLSAFQLARRVQHSLMIDSQLQLETTRGRQASNASGSGSSDSSFTIPWLTRLQDENFCRSRASTVPNKLVKSTRPSLSRKYDYVKIIKAFVRSKPLDIVISYCTGDVSWIQELGCGENLHIHIYLKCSTSTTTLDQYLSMACVQTVDLFADGKHGPEATLRHFIYENYDSLNMTYFCKDRDQNGARIHKTPTGPLRRLGLGLLALGDHGGFVHTAQDPAVVDKKVLPDLFTLLGWNIHPATSTSQYYRCGSKLGFRACEKHWWFKLIDGRSSVDWLSQALTWRTQVRHYKRDTHFYSVLQPFRNGELLDTGGFQRDHRGFPPLAQVDSFCQLYSLLTCLPCSNPWLPGRTQFIVSSRRMRSIPKEVYRAANKQVLSEYTWGLVFNCFQPYEVHAEGGLPFILCDDL